MTTAELNAVLQRVVDRSEDQKLAHIAKLREELHGLGFSVVTTEWLHAVFSRMTVEDMELITRKSEPA